MVVAAAVSVSQPLGSEDKDQRRNKSTPSHKFTICNMFLEQICEYSLSTDTERYLIFMHLSLLCLHCNSLIEQHVIVSH